MCKGVRRHLRRVVGSPPARSARRTDTSSVGCRRRTDRVRERTLHGCGLRAPGRPDGQAARDVIAKVGLRGWELREACPELRYGSLASERRRPGRLRNHPETSRSLVCRRVPQVPKYPNGRVGVIEYVPLQAVDARPPVVPASPSSAYSSTRLTQAVEQRQRSASRSRDSSGIPEFLGLGERDWKTALRSSSSPARAGAADRC